MVMGADLLVMRCETDGGAEGAMHGTVDDLVRRYES